MKWIFEIWAEEGYIFHRLSNKSLEKNTIYEISKKKMEQRIQRPVICETFIYIRITHTNTFQKYQQNWGFNISLIWQNLKRKTLFRANFKKDLKGRCFIVEKFQIINIVKAVKLYQYIQTRKFFHKIFGKSCFKVGKI